MPVDEATLSCPREGVATWYGANQDGEASRSFREGAELWRIEIADDLNENLVGKVFEAD